MIAIVAVILMSDSERDEKSEDGSEEKNRVGFHEWGEGVARVYT